jgi:hypothetical protein
MFGDMRNSRGGGVDSLPHKPYRSQVRTIALAKPIP